MFAISSTLYVVHIGLYLVGANFYDMWQYRRQHRRQNRKAQDYQPLVTVIMSAHNEEKVLVRSLESIVRSSYKKIQIVVMDDASTDATLAIARRFQRQHPQFDMTVGHMKTNVGKGKALNHGLSKFARGELVMTLDGDSLVSPKAIENAVSYFTDPTIAGVAANVRVIEEHSVLSVLQTIEHMIGYRSKKFYSVTGCEFVVGGVASTYRMSVLREVGFYDTDTLTEDIGLSTKIVNQGNRRYRMIYGADIAAMTEGVATFKALFRQRYRWKYGSMQNLVKYRHLIARPRKKYTHTLTLYRMPMAVFSELVILVGPFIWLYVIYASMQLHDPRLAIGAYFTITAYTMMTLWFDEHIKFWNRLRMSFYAPIMYFIFYIMDLVQLAAVLRCAFKIRSLLKQKETGSTWVSPERVGREVTVS
jgi:cellulose synthase/poly-beta-1,6-N-acetylglucosamine synthase-like glycosyltransferase